MVLYHTSPLFGEACGGTKLTVIEIITTQTNKKASGISGSTSL